MIQIESFWTSLGGTMGLTLDIVRPERGPAAALDFTTANTAQIRHRDSATHAVSIWTATILTAPAATPSTVSVQHIVADPDFAVLGAGHAWGLLSFDGGTTYYATDGVEVRLVDT